MKTVVASIVLATIVFGPFKSSDELALAAGDSAVKIEGKFKKATVLEDVNLLQAEMTSATVSPKLSDNLELGKAAKIEFVKPALSGCALDTQLLLSSQNGTKLLVQLQGPESCKSFIKAAASALELRFTDVPLMNGGSVKEVTIKISR